MASNKNKSQLIDAPKVKLTTKNHTVHQTNADTDIMVIQTAINISREGKKVVVVGEEINLLKLC